MVNTIIALLVELELLTKEEGELMAQKIKRGTLPQEYAASVKQVKQWLKEAKSGQE